MLTDNRIIHIGGLSEAINRISAKEITLGTNTPAQAVIGNYYTLLFDKDNFLTKRKV